jgi:hypothetical protein
MREEKKEEEAWCYFNRNFESAVFRNKVNADQYMAYQMFLDNVWKKFEFKAINGNNLLNEEVKSELKFWVVR